MLIDEVIINIKAGDGGTGAVSFRQEKYVAKGGPDGGDGGRGGSVYFLATSSTHGLTRYQGRKDFAAEDGERGGHNLRHGKNGEDLTLNVPPGTRITEILEDGTEQLIADLATEDQQLLLAKGGRGGRGNWHFRGPINQAPREFEPGRPGKRMKLKLELQLLADVGLVGLPNAGKSTLLSVISNARPKIADYPFTTLEPNLGVVTFHEHQFVVADIPGLIEGASEGKGLGIEFLKHIRRTRLIVHLVAATEEDPEATLKIIQHELKQFDTELADRRSLVVMTKIDLVEDWQKLHKDFIKKHKAMGISAASNVGVKELLQTIHATLAD